MENDIKSYLDRKEKYWLNRITKAVNNGREREGKGEVSIGLVKIEKMTKGVNYESKSN